MKVFSDNIIIALKVKTEILARQIVSIVNIVFESESKLWTTQFRLLSFLPVIVDVFESISPLRDIKNHPKYDQDIKKRNEI